MPFFFPQNKGHNTSFFNWSPKPKKQLGNKTLPFPKDLAQVPITKPAVQHKVQR